MKFAHVALTARYYARTAHEHHERRSEASRQFFAQRQRSGRIAAVLRIRLRIRLLQARGATEARDATARSTSTPLIPSILRSVITRSRPSSTSGPSP